ncbi:rho-gdp dissociation inhibitor [Blyttiomyces helicus]|uniref:Rho GDP-dissociation inhibitor n=1 Tax=Blyttiomyces helicus TaxID=388810 RepID=A0A4P9VWS9_9FUNG|nr:rho-gdp dissociation inhibitor [Blyttiomyces helicus]|eukprot:RKO82710.1 rho-gdp dissociation inhibitor [Blyttiomyces helicus]
MSDHKIDESADDLAPTATSGYKVGAKKTVEELAQLDAADESLKKWKESLGLKGQAAGPADDPRKVVVLALALEVDGRSDVVVDLSTPDAIKALENQNMTIKEGVEYRLKVKFKVQHDVISGLKYLHVVKRKGIKVDKMEEMLGSYGPAADPYEKKFLTEEAPSGMLARGHYVVKSRFVDDDNHCHLEWTWVSAASLCL